jgi:hypothetical protein
MYDSLITNHDGDVKYCVSPTIFPYVPYHATCRIEYFKTHFFYGREFNQGGFAMKKIYNGAGRNVLWGGGNCTMGG